jgi:integrase
MRRGEILRLKKSDVVLGDLGGFISLKDTKSGDNRKVPLTKELTEFFKQVIKSDSGSEYIFVNNKGKPFSDISQSWEEACRRAGIDDLRFHDLRHTFCTRMAHEGVSPFAIMAIVGHKDAKTAKRYTNLTNEHLLAAMSKLSKGSRIFSQQQQNEDNGKDSQEVKKDVISNT